MARERDIVGAPLKGMKVLIAYDVIRQKVIWKVIRIIENQVQY